MHSIHSTAFLYFWTNSHNRSLELPSSWGINDLFDSFASTFATLDHVFECRAESDFVKMLANRLFSGCWIKLSFPVFDCDADITHLWKETSLFPLPSSIKRRYVFIHSFIHSFTPATGLLNLEFVEFVYKLITTTPYQGHVHKIYQVHTSISRAQPGCSRPYWVTRTSS